MACCTSLPGVSLVYLAMMCVSVIMCCAWMSSIPCHDVRVGDHVLCVDVLDPSPLHSHLAHKHHHTHHPALLPDKWTASSPAASLSPRWSGVERYIDSARAVGDVLPTIPSLLTTSLPGYAQSEVYQRPLGPRALPMEYYLVPTDHYLARWYTDATALYGSDLPSLYRDADKWFK